jgi:TolA-binding protein
LREIGIDKGFIMPKVSSLIAAFCLLFLAAGVSSAQQIHLPPAVSQSQGMGSVPVYEGDQVQRQQAMAANQQRQAEIRRDTEKMAELTQELKDFLVKGEPGVMSMDAIKKAEQIEKLAKSVKSKMKQSL